MTPRILEGERHSPLRARIIAGLLCVGFAAAGIRGGMVALGGAEPVPATFANTIEAAQKMRADILDRNGERLATSIPVYSLYADPGAVWDAGNIADQLVSVFPELDRETIMDRLSDSGRQFVWLKRGITPNQRQAVFELGLEGIGFQEEARRFYPQKTLAAHAIGFTDVDGKGLSGVEYTQNDRLASSLEPIRLTLDLSVQYSLEAELASIAARSNAKGGAGIVMNGKTGEVLALASWPAFDPNRRQEFSSHEILDRATGAVYELGSVFKPLTMAAALDFGVVTPRETFNVSRPIEIGVETIRDDHPMPGSHAASPTGIITYSSNIGTVQIAQRIGLDNQRRFLQSLGLFERSPVELSASESPLLPADWSPITQATVSFGHGISVSPMAFASAFAAFANEGTYMPPTLILTEDPLAPEREPRRVMSSPTSQVVTQMMRAAVTDGTGRQADIPGYRLAGKTGTAEKVINGKYTKDRNIASFAAVFPADNPEYAVLIVLDEPVSATGRSETAALNAAPAVGRVVERIAPILNVMPFFEDIEPQEFRTRTVSDRRSL